MANLLGMRSLDRARDDSFLSLFELSLNLNKSLDLASLGVEFLELELVDGVFGILAGVVARAGLFVLHYYNLFLGFL